MPLDAYRRKRDPIRTPEPFPPADEESAGAEPSFGQPLKRAASQPGAAPVGPLFVVQRHAARRLHYDLRLEREGALASWAVPKGLPLRRGERNLAVHVEDHPLDYASFEGEIPKGQYGAGTVEIWDRGTYELLEEKHDGGLTVRLHGERVDGTWTLVPAALDGDPRNWLLMRKDADGPPGRAYRPQLAVSAETLPSGPNWSFEPKWDGYRVVVAVGAAGVTLTSRNGNDLGGRFGSLTRSLAAALRTPSAVLDGEVCALDDEGRPSFGSLQQGEGHLVFVAFDLLELDGRPLVDEPLERRRALLERTVDAAAGSVLVSPSFDDGVALLDAARERGLEGVVAKRRDAPYRAGRRTPDWIKVKVRGRDDLPVVGYTLGKGARASLGALVLARAGEEGLRWAGNVGTGFTEHEVRRLLAMLRPLERATSPLAEVPRMPRVRRSDVQWVDPVLRAEVAFAEWTREGRLRAPVYLGLREDVVVPDELPTEVRRGRRSLRLSNLDKPFWPEEGITKGDLLSYYRRLAAVVVPHLRHRPFTMKRYPDGWQGKSFFQKQAPAHRPGWLRTAAFPASTRDGERRTIDYALVDDELALLWVVNMGCIDLHAWSSRVDRPDRPDWVIFDLDPSEGVDFRAVAEVALLVKEALDLSGLESYPKTSGSKGMHVLVPIARRHSYDDVRSFAGIVAGALARAHPGLVTTEWTKSKRRGVLVDANQNGPGRTTASVYSVRPRSGAPVSAPLHWREVDASLDPATFTMDVVVERVAREGDLFAPVLSTRQSLTAALRSVTAS